MSADNILQEPFADSSGTFISPILFGAHKNFQGHRAQLTPKYVFDVFVRFLGVRLFAAVPRNIAL